MKADFVAIDFELANNHWASAVEIGLSRGNPNGVLTTFSSLIRPPSGLDEFLPRNVKIQGITASEIRNAPYWEEIWPEVEDFIGESPLVAHNASFDMSVLRAIAAVQGRSFPELDYWCTWVLSKNSLNLSSYSLQAVSRALDIDHPNEHRSLSDSISAARVVQKFLKMQGANTLDELGEINGVAKGHLYADSWETCHAKTSTSQSEVRELREERLRELGVDYFEPDPSGDFVGKNVAITGTLWSMSRAEAQDLLEKSGARVRTSVSARLDYLVSGLQDVSRLAEGYSTSSKFRKVEELRNAGHSIEILDEEQFLQLIRS